MSGISKQIEKSRDLAQIETDEAETWHTLRLLHTETENIN